MARNMIPLDISRCSNMHCPIRPKCARSSDVATGERYSIAAFATAKPPETCEYFIDNGRLQA